MLSTSISLELDNDENEMGKTEVENVEQEQDSVLEQPKFYEVE